MKTLKKVLSGALCALISMLAPGIGAYQAAAQDINARAEIPSGIAMPLAPASVGVGMQNLGMDSAQSFLDAFFNKGENNPMEALPQNAAKRVANASQSAEIKSAALGRRDERGRPNNGAIGTQAAGLKASLKKRADKIVKATQKIRQAVKDHIAGKIANWSGIFDGSLQPAYAGAANAPFAPQVSALGEAKALYLKEAANDASNGSSQVQPPASSSNKIETLGGFIVSMFPSQTVQYIQNHRLTQVTLKYDDHGQIKTQTLEVNAELLNQIGNGEYQGAVNQGTGDFWLTYAVPRLAPPANGSAQEGSPFVVTLPSEKGAAKIRELKLTQIEIVPPHGIIRVGKTVPVTEDLLQQVLQGVFQVAYDGNKPNNIWLMGPIEQTVGGGEKNNSAPKKQDLSWPRFFAGISGAAVDAIVAAAGIIPLAFYYAPQAYWYGYQAIWDDKSIGFRYKLGGSALLAPIVPLAVVAAPLIGLIYGIGKGFSEASSDGLIPALRDSVNIIRDIKDYLQKGKKYVKEGIQREKAEPRPTQVKDLPLAALAKGLSGSLAALLSFPIPAFFTILVQSNRVFYYGLKSLWKSETLGFRYKLAISLLFPISYILLNALALPGTAIAALVGGFMEGQKLGPAAAFKEGWDDVKSLNQMINAAISGLKRGEFPGVGYPREANANDAANHEKILAAGNLVSPAVDPKIAAAANEGASASPAAPSDAQKAAAAQLSIGGLIFGLDDGYLEQGSKDGYPAKFTPSAVELLRQMNSAPPPAGDQLAAVSLEVSNKFLLRFAKIMDQINDRTGGNKAEFVKVLHDVLLDPLTKQVVLKEGGFKTYQEALDAINSVLSQAEAGGAAAAGAYVGLSPEKGAAKIRELKLTQIRVVPLYGPIKVSMTVPVTEDLLQQVLQGVFQVAYKGDAPNFIWLEGPRK